MAKKGPMNIEEIRLYNMVDIKGTICGSCGLVQHERNDRCWYCGVGLCGTVQ